MLQVEDVKERADASQMDNKVREEAEGVELWSREAVELRHKEQLACVEREATVVVIEQDMQVGLEALMQRPIEEWSCEDVLQWAESLVLPAAWKASLRAGLANDETDGEDLGEMTVKRIQKRFCKGLEADAASQVAALRDQVIYHYGYRYEWWLLLQMQQQVGGTDAARHTQQRCSNRDHLPHHRRALQGIDIRASMHVHRHRHVHRHWYMLRTPSYAPMATRTKGRRY